ncbi:B12-binding domain-containing radical SAM protein [Desulfocicer niacini]
MPHIILIQPPVEDFYFTFKRSIPYGLASIAASLIRKGFSVEILDALAVKKSMIIPYPEEMASLETWYGDSDSSHFSLFHHYRHYGYSFEHLGKIVRDKTPFLVGISSLFTPYADMALQTARMVKKFYPHCPIVLGGHHPTRFPREVLDCDSVDFVLQGEGEVSMPLLAEILAAMTGKNISGNFNTNLTHITQEQETRLTQVPGIAFRTRSGAMHVSSTAWMSDLSAQALPQLDLINQKFYSRKGRGSAVVVAGRGCPMQCTYCSVGASSTHARFRLRPVEQVLAEIKYSVENHSTGFIDFEDENLTLNHSWCLALLSGIREITNDVELRAMNGLYTPSLNDELVKAMKQAGFRTLNLSLGSSCATQLKAFRRPDVRASHDNALVLAEKQGMEAVSYLIAGAPGQKALQSVKDLLFLASRRTLAGLSIYYPAPGSVDYDVCRERGLLPDHFSLMRSTALPIEDTTTRLASVTLLRLARILNFMKSLKDQKISLPTAHAFNKQADLDPSHRQTCSLKLIQGFLHDGQIRGITPEGRVFKHKIDLDLSLAFVAGLSRTQIRGTL